MSEAVFVCRLKEIITERGIKQSDVAKATGFSVTTVGRYCGTGKLQQIDAEKIDKFMDYLELDNFTDLIELRRPTK